jgi:hypothetical protein
MSKSLAQTCFIKTQLHILYNDSILVTNRCPCHVAPGRAETDSNDQNPNALNQEILAQSNSPLGRFEFWTFEF